MIIKGLYNEAKVFTNKIEESAVIQIKELLDLESFKDSKIRIMPDVHKGAGCVIGFTANLGDKVIPNIVGVDIGCGMLTTELGNVELDLPSLDKYINEHIPSGREINFHKEFDYLKEINTLKCIRSIKGRAKEWNRAIGSLGGGNHFIEVNIDDNNNKYLVIHTGSRNLGNRVANYYQKLAVDYHSGLDDSYYEEKDQLIKTYKEEGRRNEIEKDIKALRKSKLKILTIPKDLCYLEGTLKEDYLHDMKICQTYGVKNRETIAHRIVSFLFKSDNFEMFHTIHNYIDFEDSIVRKGAIKADKGTKLLIPINMRDGSILAKGLGNEEWNFSAPHGAGRLLSRTMAKESITLEEFKNSMKGIYTTSVNEKTIDESPMAYKSLEEILANIKGSVEVIKILKPIYNFKASN